MCRDNSMVFSMYGSFYIYIYIYIYIATDVHVYARLHLWFQSIDMNNTAPATLQFEV